ncbi:hypothetical protein FQN54_006465 [Arachnomyces sp. PD_36]|nr:hypothetical protein FQN54_006465 [Arachnomyces sp. PD_36]
MADSEIPKSALDVAAIHTSSLLRDLGRQHAFIGGYAALLLGGNRSVNNVDIIIDVDPETIQKDLIQAGSGSIFPFNKKFFRFEVFDSGFTVNVIIKLFHGGSGSSISQYRLPHPSVAPLIVPRVMSTDIPVIHPSVLISTKVKRWKSIAASTRPETAEQATRDIVDIEIILQWLEASNMGVSFKTYPEKSTRELLDAFSELHAKGGDTIRTLMRATMPGRTWVIENA